MGLRYRAKPEKNEEDEGKNKKKKASKGKVGGETGILPL